MLVLTRKRQQEIRIGDDITISILKIKGNSVRVGIHAPRDVRVIRAELPVFASMEANDPEEAGAAEASAESGEEESTVSELEWEAMKRLSNRKKPCLPVRRCLANGSSVAKRRQREQVNGAEPRATESAVAATD